MRLLAFLAAFLLYGPVAFATIRNPSDPIPTMPPAIATAANPAIAPTLIDPNSGPCIVVGKSSTARIAEADARICLQDGARCSLSRKRPRCVQMVRRGGSFSRQRFVDRRSPLSLRRCACNWDTRRGGGRGVEERREGPDVGDGDWLRDGAGERGGEDLARGIRGWEKGEVKSELGIGGTGMMRHLRVKVRDNDDEGIKSRPRGETVNPIHALHLSPKSDLTANCCRGVLHFQTPVPPQPRGETSQTLNPKQNVTFEPAGGVTTRYISASRRSP